MASSTFRISKDQLAPITEIMLITAVSTCVRGIACFLSTATQEVKPSSTGLIGLSSKYACELMVWMITVRTACSDGRTNSIHTLKSYLPEAWWVVTAIFLIFCCGVQCIFSNTEAVRSEYGRGRRWVYNNVVMLSCWCHYVEPWLAAACCSDEQNKVRR